ncbi:MAG: 16S rRNA (adenine(1518)-N(6)/adenine(1519)-N(6))-dimethyltransferase RsmA [Bacteroidota bacterium]
MSIKPKKNLGQHFLWDKNIARKIVEIFREEASTSIVLEVGPGKGVLTDFLLEYFGDQLYAVEIDQESVDYLLKIYSELGDRLIRQDFLKMNLKDYFTQPISLIGNFPYNISSQILFKVLEHRNSIPFVIGMLQKEVADRIVSSPGSKIYGKLSVLLQAFYNIKILFPVSSHSFTPPPKVKSAVIRLKRNETWRLACNEEMFFRVVKESFNQRRKILGNSLKPFLLNLDVKDERFRKRPEQLDVKDFVEITEKLSQG